MSHANFCSSLCKLSCCVILLWPKVRFDSFTIKRLKCSVLHIIVKFNGEYLTAILIIERVHDKQFPVFQFLLYFKHFCTDIFNLGSTTWSDGKCCWVWDDEPHPLNTPPSKSLLTIWIGYMFILSEEMAMKQIFEQTLILIMF